MKNILFGFGLLTVLALVGCQNASDEAGTDTASQTSVVTESSVSVDVQDSTSDLTFVDSEENTSSKVISAMVVPKIEFYHGETCPHCHNLIAYLPEVEKMYPGLVIESYEVWNNPDNAQKGRQRLSALGSDLRSVPTIIIGEEVLSGFDKNGMLSLMKKHYGNPVQ